jgi:hypothetical protein
VCDAKLAKELERIFNQDIKGCEVMTLAKWRRRPLLDKFLQNTVSLLQEQV